MAISLSNLATSEECQYKNEHYGFKCHEPSDIRSKFCIFHNKDYLKGDNYEKHKKEVAEKFKERLSKHRSRNEPLKFIGYYLSEISLQGEQFTEVHFNLAAFYGVANFAGATFSDKAHFYGAIFYNGADFSKATFSNEADFYGIRFSNGSTGEANFSRAKFSGEAYFNSAKFSGGADFSEAEFSGGAYFPGAKFSVKAWFSGAKFSGVADFSPAGLPYLNSERQLVTSEAKFSVEANFSGAKFSGRVVFNLVEFFGAPALGANFNSAGFTGEVDFSGAKFSGGADFSGAKFSGRVVFSEAEFYEAGANANSVSFSRAKFSGGAYFNLANFYEVVYFDSAEFSGGAYFPGAKFSVKAWFSGAKFSGVADFSSKFKGRAYFNYVLFEDGKKILFDAEDLSKVSFLNTDITRVRFSETARWGIGKKDKDRFKIIEERWLENSPKKIKNLGSIMAVYRNLRENYEFRLRYDEAGKFFIREMELKRRYREIISEDGNVITKQNCWFRRNLSLTGLYYRFSNYGESIVKPTLIGVITVGLSTLFWLTQSKPALEPHFFVSGSSSIYNSTSHFVYLNQAGNLTHWLTAFQRSLADFLPLLSLPSDIKVGVIDYIIKIVGGALTFGLLVIAMRRKFERKYTR